MDASLINSETIELMSRLTGQKLRRQHITPAMVFMAALLSVLAGVMFADGQVTASEKKHWQATLDKLAPSGSKIYKLVQILSKNIRDQHIYDNLHELLGLVALLSDSEKLLLIGFGYQMSAADGKMDASEKKFLGDSAQGMGVDPEHIAVLEAVFSRKAIADPKALETVRSLLDPARFQSLDPLLVNAASQIHDLLPGKPKQQRSRQGVVSSYEDLKKFQEYRKKLYSVGYKLFQITKSCAERQFLPKALTGRVGQVSKKIQSQRFRVAVVGEFSRGKSTLLNALLGEPIQPVRAIPCSGTVSVLRYGTTKRVICRYKDGREEEIPVEKYKEKAALSKEAALKRKSDELASSQIAEIIFEHPDLELCRSGVEIVDSPGLNEHPERNAITQQLLKDTDAAIFLSNAQQPLNLGEQQLLDDLKTQLNGGKAGEAADNLFIAVNFWDMIRSSEDRQDVRERIENLIFGENPLIKGENRLHFLSAQSSLDAILTGVDNEYLKDFENFTASLKKFLTTERNSVKIKRSVAEIQEILQKSVNGLHQSEAALNGKLKISEEAKQEILEQIGEASGRDVRITLLAKKLIAEALKEAGESWEQWRSSLRARMAEKSKGWQSKHLPVLSQKELIEDYANQFVGDLHQEIDAWGNAELKNAILQPKLQLLDQTILKELEAINQNLRLIDMQINSNFSQQLNLQIAGLEGYFGGFHGFLIGIQAVNLYGLVFAGIALNPLFIPTVASAIGVLSVYKLLKGDGIHDQIKQKVFELGFIKQKVLELGFEKVDESLEKISQRFDEIISSAFGGRLQTAEEKIAEIISYYENILEQQEKIYQETAAQRQTEKTWIAQQRQELDRIQKELDAILSQAAA